MITTINTLDEIMIGKVKCPNMCQSGYVKHYPDSEKALYTIIRCQFCKGSGYIPESHKNRIESMI